MATTNLGKVAVVPRGEYSPNTQYERLDIVQYAGSSYLVIDDVLGVTPVEGGYYSLLASRGLAGAKGTDGSFTQKGYLTEAAMIADKANIPANTSVDVLNDGAKNGTYLYDGTTFTKSPYDPVALALEKTVSSYKDVFGSANIDLDSSPLILARNTLYPEATGKWGTWSKSDNVFISVNAGDSLSISASDNNQTNYKFLNVLPVRLETYDNTNPVLKNTRVEAGATATVTVPVGQSILWLSIKNTSGDDRKPKSVYNKTQGSLVNKSQIINSVTSLSDEDSILSGAMGNDIYSKLEKLKEHNYSFNSVSSSLTPSVIQGGYLFGLENTNNSNNLTSYRIRLKKDDVLTYVTTDYAFLSSLSEQITIVDSEGASKFVYMPLRYKLVDSNIIYAETYVAKRDIILIVTGAENIKLNNATPPIASIDSLGLFRKSNQLDFDASIPDSKFTNTIDVKKGDIIKITNPLIGLPSIIRKENYTSGDTYPVFGINSTDDIVHNILYWKAPSDTNIRLVGHNNSEFSIHRHGSVELPLSEKLSNLKNEVGASSTTVPSVINLPTVMSSVFATDKNFILKNEVIDGVDTVLTTNDLGRTWAQAPNILAEIVMFHIFGDGTILLCSNTKAITMSAPYEQMVESTVLNEDGSPYVPNTYQFFMQMKGNPLQYIDDTEMFVWGDYVLRGTPRIWYTTNSGKTLKCAAKFGTTVMDGQTRPTRHVHSVTQRRKDNRFYVTTGDAGDECFVMSMGYDLANDTWDFKHYASGDIFKLGDIYFDDYFAYVMTDYTLAVDKAKNGLYRVPVNALADITQYQPIYKSNLEELGQAAISRFIQDRNGNKVIFPDYAGTGFIWVATEGTDFKKVILSPSKGLSYRIGVNYNGDCYVVTFNSKNEYLDQTQLKINRGSYNLTEIMRDAGIKNFMRGGLLFEGTWLTN